MLLLQGEGGLKAHVPSFEALTSRNITKSERTCFMDDPDKLVGLGPSNIAEPVNNEAKKFIQRHVCRGTEVEGNFETRTR